MEITTDSIEIVHPQLIVPGDEEPEIELLPAEEKDVSQDPLMLSDAEKTESHNDTEKSPCNDEVLFEAEKRLRSPKNIEFCDSMIKSAFRKKKKSKRKTIKKQNINTTLEANNFIEASYKEKERLRRVEISENFKNLYETLPLRRKIYLKVTKLNVLREAKICISHLEKHEKLLIKTKQNWFTKIDRLNEKFTDLFDE